MQVATGSASIVSNNVVDLSFPVSGTIAQINVIPGDTVKKGEVLATMSGTDQLQLSITAKELALQTAQKATDDLQSNADTALSTAQLAVATDQSALLTAQQNLRQKGLDAARSPPYSLITSNGRTTIRSLSTPIRNY